MFYTRLGHCSCAVFSPEDSCLGFLVVGLAFNDEGTGEAA